MSAGSITLRNYHPDDLDAVIDVFLRAIRVTAAANYTPEQVAAWAQADRSLWQKKRLSRPTWVACVQDRVAGFTDLEPDGHLDMMFVDPDFGRRGIGSRLIARAEAEATALRLPRIFAEVSLTARPLFAANGFQVLSAEQVSRNGQSLDRFRMEKRLIA
jgi:putative acetyltransferase